MRSSNPIYAALASLAAIALLGGCGDSDGTTPDTDAGGDTVIDETDGRIDRPDAEDDAGGFDTVDGDDDASDVDQDADTSGSDADANTDAGDTADDTGDSFETDGSADVGDGGSELLCGNGELNDGEECDDGDANGTAPDACRANCELADCGDGIIDSDEECDDGADNDDRLANACRSTCEAATCGDGVIDRREQCDDGDLNDEAGACLPGCALNLAVACDGFDIDDFSEFATPFGSGESLLFNIFSFDSVLTAPAGCVDGDRTDGGERTFFWSTETAGTFRVSTAYPATGIDTVVYIFDDCEGGRLVECNDTARAGTAGSDLVFDAEAGAPYFITVDSVGIGGPVQLSILPVDGDLSGVGGDCVTVDDCGGGLDCALGTCTADTAPTLTGGTARYVPATDTLLLEIQGTDPDANVVNVNFPILRFDDGSDAIQIVLTRPPNVVTSGTNFRVSLRIGGLSTFSASEAAALTSLSVVAVDALGQESAPLSLTTTVVGTPVVVGSGAACDPAGADPVCDVDLSCGRRADGSDSCGTSIAPTITTGTGRWVTNTRVRIDATVLDLDRDLDTAGIVAWENRAGGAVNIAVENVELVDIVFRDTEIDLGWDVDVTGRNPAVAIIEVTDEAGNTAQRRIDFGARPTPVGLGANCGAGVICSSGLICTPRGAGGSTCTTSVAPRVLAFEAFFDSDDNTTATFEISGFDANADAELIGFFIYGDDESGEIDFDNELDLLVFDVTAFPGLVNTGFSGRLEGIAVPPEATWAGAVILDAAGNASSQLLDVLAPERISGEACDGTSSQPCRNDLVCRADSICGAPTAPMLSVARVERIGELDFLVTVSGVDPDNDVNVLSVGFLLASGEPVTNDAGNAIGGNIGFDEFDDGDGTFSGNSLLTLTGFTEPEIFAQLSVAVRDFSGRFSEAVIVPIPPALAPGETCDSEDPSAGGCSQNSLCIDSTCETISPILSQVDVARPDAIPETLTLTISGEYLFEDISGYAILFSADGVGDELLVDEFEPAAISYDADTDDWSGTLNVSIAAPRDVFTDIRFSVLNNAGDESNQLSVEIPVLVP
jgi:cysteine-rich repeat protein